VNRRIGEPETIGAPVLRFPGSPVLPFLFFLSLLWGCRQVILPSREIPSPFLEQLDSVSIPPFLDDLDRLSLKTAVQQSLVALRKKNEVATFAFGEKRVPVSRVRESLTAFLWLLDTEADLQGALRRDFAVQRGVGRQQLADAEQALPAQLRHGGRLRQQRGLVVHVQHAGGILGALGVAGHPEQMVGGAAQHENSLDDE